MPRKRLKARALYEDVYCARGDMENRIKEQQLDLFADRTSAATMRANQLRLYLSLAAYMLLHALRRLGLKGTDMARVQCHTIRLKLLKIGARIRPSRLDRDVGSLSLGRDLRHGRAIPLGAKPNAQCGAVTFIQRFGSALNLNLHLHMLAIDGVYAADDDGNPRFHAVPAPGDHEIARLAGSLAERIPKWLIGRGLGPDTDPEEADPLSRDQPWLAGLYAASISGRTAFGPNPGRRVTRVGDRVDPESMTALASPRCASVNGFSLHANVAVAARDRQRLERLARYCARPPIAMERIEPLPDPRRLYRFKRPWRDGTTHVVFEGLELLEKLSALVPAPRTHLVRYSGILAPAAKWRALIVPNEADAQSAPMPDAAGTPKTPIITASPAPGDAAVAVRPVAVEPRTVPHPRNYTWAELMKRVWALARISHELSATVPDPSASAAFRFVGLLDVPSSTPPVPSGRAPCSDGVSDSSRRKPVRKAG